LVLPLTQKLCHDLVERGHKVAWVDEVDLSLRDGWPLPCRLRFDVGQALSEHVNLSAALHLLRPHLMYGMSCQTRHIHHVPRDLQARLLTSGVRFDTLVIAAHPNSEPVRYAQHVHHTVFTETDQSSLTQTLAWMKQIEARAEGAASWHVVPMGSISRRNALQTWMDESCSKHMSHPVQVLGWAAPKTLTKPLTSAWAHQLDLQDLLMQHLLQH
jgi:hypothetical protein